MPQASTERAALIVIAAGVCAALHVGKLAPAIAALQQALEMCIRDSSQADAGSKDPRRSMKPP